MAFSSFGSALLTLGRFGFLSLLVAAGATAVACGGETGRNGVRGDGQGSNGDGNGDGNGSGGLPGLPGDDDPSTGPNGQEYCQEADIVFEPRTPTVFVLVDRSGTIYDLQLWVPLRDGVLPVIQDLQSDVRFGFATYTGTNQMCTGLEQPVGAAMNNYDAIASAYTGLSTNHPGGKLETPTAYAIEQTADLLVADADATGDKFILLVTGDVDPDFCDDGETRCGADGVVAAAQVAYSRGVHTLVFAIEHAGISTPEWFDYYAQAGMGQHPNWPDGLVNSDQGGSIYSNCKDRVGIPAGYWQTLREQNGNTGFQPAGKYSVEGGTAQAFLNDDVSQIAAGIRTAVEGLKSCTFDLALQGISPRIETLMQQPVLANEPYALLHGDLRSDNLRFRQGRLYLFDWPAITVGRPEWDIVVFAQSVTVEGGVAPEQVMTWYAEAFPVDPAAVDCAIAWWFAFFAARAWREEIPGLPRVRRFQRQQLATLALWAARQWSLPEPIWAWEMLAEPLV